MMTCPVNDASAFRTHAPRQLVEDVIEVLLLGWLRRGVYLRLRGGLNHGGILLFMVRQRTVIQSP